MVRYILVKWLEQSAHELYRQADNMFFIDERRTRFLGDLAGKLLKRPKK